MDVLRRRPTWQATSGYKTLSSGREIGGGMEAHKEKEAKVMSYNIKVKYKNKWYTTAHRIGTLTAAKKTAKGTYPNQQTKVYKIAERKRK